MDKDKDNDQVEGDALEPWVDPALEARLVAMLLGEASDFERSELGRILEAKPEARIFFRRMQAVDALVREAEHPAVRGRRSEKEWRLAPARRKAVLRRIRRSEAPARTSPPAVAAGRVGPVPLGRSKRRPWPAAIFGVAAAVVVSGVAVVVFTNRAVVTGAADARMAGELKTNVPRFRVGAAAEPEVALSAREFAESESLGRVSDGVVNESWFGRRGGTVDFDADGGDGVPSSVAGRAFFGGLAAAPSSGTGGGVGNGRPFAENARGGEPSVAAGPAPAPAGESRLASGIISDLPGLKAGSRSSRVAGKDRVARPGLVEEQEPLDRIRAEMMPSTDDTLWAASRPAEDKNGTGEGGESAGIGGGLAGGERANARFFRNQPEEPGVARGLALAEPERRPAAGEESIVERGRLGENIGIGGPGHGVAGAETGVAPAPGEPTPGDDHGFDPPVLGSLFARNPQAPASAAVTNGVGVRDTDAPAAPAQSTPDVVSDLAEQAEEVEQARTEAIERQERFGIIDLARPVDVSDAESSRPAEGLIAELDRFDEQSDQSGNQQLAQSHFEIVPENEMKGTQPEGGEAADERRRDIVYQYDEARKNYADQKELYEDLFDAADELGVITGPADAPAEMTAPENPENAKKEAEVAKRQAEEWAEANRPAPVDVETAASEEPFSTFSLHVGDVAFKLAAHALLEEGGWPDASQVRVEEFVNAFDFGDPPAGLGEKVACRIEQAVHPFRQQRNLVRISMRTAAIGRAVGRPLHLTILLDKSGSMERADREASVLLAMDALASHLGSGDVVTVIAFARRAHLIADRVPGDRASELVALVERTPSEGGTNLEEALRLAGETARRQFLGGAQNRIVLVTDGAANLGNADPETLRERIVELRNQGIAFDACGVGAEGLDDAILEALTREGDGRYYFLNRPEDADEGFVRQLAGALRPAARNVKVQVRFDPRRVGRYRLLGFERHRLEKEDFRDDSVDAAEMAEAEAGVAVYEVEVLPDGRGELGEVSVRFEDASDGRMVERTWTIPHDPAPPRLDEATPSMQLAAVAALLGEKLRGGPAAATIALDELTPVAVGLRQAFPGSTRVEQLVEMLRRADSLAR